MENTIDPSNVPGAPTGQAMAAASGYLPTLDGWRALAVLAVITRHARDPYFGPGGAFENPTLEKLTSYGHLGVDFFFGLSGLLICSRLLDEWSITGEISLRRFYIRRVFRILPPYFAYLAVVGLLAIGGAIAVTGMEYVSCVFFFRNYYFAEGFGWYTAHFWSLCVEEHFYLLFPPLLVLLGRRRAAMGVAVMLFVVFLWQRVSFRYVHILPTAPRSDLILDRLFYGCLVAILLWQYGSRPIVRALLSGWSMALAAIGFVAAVALQFSMHGVLMAAAIPVLIACTMTNPHWLLSRFLELGLLRWIGRMSYSLYIWQELFLSPDVSSASWLIWLQTPGISMLAIFACAALSYYAIEKPCIRMGRRLAQPTTEGAAK